MSDNERGGHTQLPSGVTGARRIQLDPHAQRPPDVGKMSRVQAELGPQGAPAGSVTPVMLHDPAEAMPSGTLSLGPDHDRPQAHVASAAIAQQDVSPQLGSQTNLGSAVAPAPAPLAQAPRTQLAFEFEHEQGPLKLRAKFTRKDGITARRTDIAAGEVATLPVEAKLKVEELKVVLSKKGLAIQETLVTAEAGVTVVDGMKISVKLAAFEVKRPLDYTLLKLTIEGAATDVPWFNTMAAARAMRVDVTVSGSLAIGGKLLAKIILELAPLEAAAQKVAALEQQVAQATRKIETAKQARDAARLEQAVAQKAEGAAARARKLALDAESAAAEAESAAITAEARALAQAEHVAARAASATAKAEVRAAQLASNAATKLWSAEKAALEQHQRVLKALLPQLESATAVMESRARGIKGVLAKQIGARIGKVLATRVGKLLMKALPVIGLGLLAKDVFDVASWMLALPWEGGRYFGQDGEGAGEGGKATDRAPDDTSAPPTSDGAVDVDGGDVDRGVAGAGTTGVGQSGTTRLPGAKPATAAASAPGAKPATTTAPASAAKPVATSQQSTMPTSSGGDHATQPAEHGNDGKDKGSGSGDSSGDGHGRTPSPADSKQPTTVSATGSSAPMGDHTTATEAATPTSTVATASNGTAAPDVKDLTDHAMANVADNATADEGKIAALPAAEASLPVPTPAQTKEQKRKAKAKADRKTRAAAEAAQRKKVANDTADRRLFWGAEAEVHGGLHWDGTKLTKDAAGLQAAFAKLQGHPRLTTTGASVALRRMHVTIGQPMGTQIPVEVRYLAEQHQGVRWVPCQQDVQSLLFDIPSQQLRVAGIGMHAVLFDGGVLQEQNGRVVRARETFTMAGIGTFQVVDPVDTLDKGTYWAVTVTLKPINILDGKATFRVDGGKWHELGSKHVKDDGITVTLKHSKATS